jgi:hypothetical protein
MQVLEESLSEFVREFFPPGLFDDIVAASPNGILLGTMSLGGPNSDPGDDELGIIDFEMETAGGLKLEGVLEPDEGVIPPGTQVMAYGVTGHVSTSTVQSDGYFFIFISDIPPGRVPYLLIFSLPRSSVQNRHLALESESRHLSSSIQPCDTMTHFWVNNVCSTTAISITLTWDGTSDLDLHVIEPSSNEVYFAYPQGDDGYLDFDDTDGHGPENYFALETSSGEYTAFVRAYSFRDSGPISWMLTASAHGNELWRRTGTLSFTGENSDSFVISVPASGRRLLERRNEASPAACKLAENAHDSCQEKVENGSCPPDYRLFWCFLNGYCDKKLEMYEDLANLAISKESVLYMVAFYFAFDGKNENNYTPTPNTVTWIRDTVTYIMDADEQRLGCFRYFFLDFICKEFDKSYHLAAAKMMLHIVDAYGYISTGAGLEKAVNSGAEAAIEVINTLGAYVAGYAYGKALPDKQELLKAAYKLNKILSLQMMKYEVWQCCGR